jgi:hypothetical protein
MQIFFYLNRLCIERNLKFPVTWGTLCCMITKHL